MKKILSIFLVALLLISFTGCKKDTEVNDAKKFKEEYESQNKKESKTGKKMREVSIPEDNPFVYISAEDLSKEIDKEETFIVYFGFSTCPWCRSIIEELIRCAEDSEVEKIYYIDVSDIRDEKKMDENGEIKTTKEGTKGYKELLDKLGEVLEEYTITNDEDEKISMEEKRIYAPNVVAVVEGKPTKMETGIGENLKNPEIELTDDIKKEIYGKFKCLFECMKEAETVCTKNSC